jgi:hypothetical protein
MLRQRVRYVMPWRLRADKNVFPRTAPRITVHGPDYHLTDRSGMCTSQRRPAPLAEASCPSRRGFVGLHKFLSRGPMKMFRIDYAPGCERSPVSLPANGTMAVTDELEWSSDFIRHSSTKTAFLYRHAETSNSTGVRPNESVGKPLRRSLPLPVCARRAAGRSFALLPSGAMHARPSCFGHVLLAHCRVLRLRRSRFP